jgi:phage-related minor tail protein
MANDPIDSGEASALSEALIQIEARTASLALSADGFARAMTRAFNQSVSGGKQFDDVLKTLVLRLSNLAVTAAFKPLAAGIAGGLNQLFNGLFGGSGGANVAAAMGAIKPFAAGGIIGTPTYFPLMGGGAGLAGEVGPEAILPLKRGADGRLGVTADAARTVTHITVHIATPDAESFRRSETYLAGQIARAVARGQRSL